MRKIRLFAVLIFFALALPFIFMEKSYAEAPEGVKAGNAYIAEDTVLNLKLLDGLDSNENQKFDLVNVALAEDLTVDNVVIIPKDTQLTGMITKIHGSRLLGESAVIRIKLRDYKLGNGRYLSFKDDLKIKGGKNYAGLASSIVVPFSGLLFKGREINCPAGTVVDYKFESNVDLNVPRSEINSLNALSK